MEPIWGPVTTPIDIQDDVAKVIFRSATAQDCPAVLTAGVDAMTISLHQSPMAGTSMLNDRLHDSQNRGRRLQTRGDPMGAIHPEVLSGAR